MLRKLTLSFLIIFVCLLSALATHNPIAFGEHNDPVPVRDVYVSASAGGDIGAKINAADAACGASPCTIHVDVQGTISTGARVGFTHPYRTLQFGPGNWTVSTTDNPISMGSNSTIKGSGWGTRISANNIKPEYSFLFLAKNNYNPDGNVDRNIHISDLQIIGNGPAGDGAHSLVNLGNCLHCSVRNVAFNSVGPIAVQIGNSSLPGASLNITNASKTNPIVITTSTPHDYETGEETTIASVGGNTNANGKFLVTVLDATRFSIPVAGNRPYTSGGTAKRNAHAIDVTVSKCSFLKVAVVNVALVNGKNVHIDNNTFRAVGHAASGNSPFVDVEPNTASDWVSEFTISNNIFDGSENVHFSTAIQVYGRTLAGAVVQKSGIISNNTIKGPKLAKGIGCSGCANIEITGNRISSTAQQAIALESCTGCKVTNNDIVDTGGASNQAIFVSPGSSLIDVSNNRLRVTSGGSSTNIDVGGTARNKFSNNVGAVYSNSSASTVIRR